MQNDAYANIVELYDLEHADFVDDLELLIELADLTEGKILELGCGTGRVALPLAEAGNQVVGIDNSKPMLDVAIARAKSSSIDAEFHLGDMSELHDVPGAPFGMIIASLNSIMHLNSQQQRQLISSSIDVLVPEGRLVIDTLNPSVSQLNHLLNKTHLEDSWELDDESTVDKWSHRQPGEESQVIETLIWYDRQQSTGAYERVRTHFNLRYVHQSELHLMLEMAGYAHVDWYGSYELDPWDPEADRIIAVAHKDSE